MSDDKTSTAQAPFDDPNGDVTLRSSDGIDFHVIKFILSFVSPVFKDMFTLPQGSQSDIPSVPVIPVEENSMTLNSLLLLCYPSSTPTFNSFEEGKAVLEAAKKYDMEATLGRAGDIVMAQFLPTNSLELYALSCRFGWQHHAQTAATQTLNSEIKDLGRSGLRDTTRFDYHRLLVYHYECGAAAEAVVGSLSWLEPSMSNNDMPMWSCGTETKAGRQLCIANLGNRVITPWFDEYLVSSGEELLARPCESTIWKSEYYNPAVYKATSCIYCQSDAVIWAMDNFRTQFAARVKQVLADVSLPDSSSNSKLTLIL
jgi:hypothetical protein